MRSYAFVGSFEPRDPDKVNVRVKVKKANIIERCDFCGVPHVAGFFVEGGIFDREICTVCVDAFAKEVK